MKQVSSSDRLARSCWKILFQSKRRRNHAGVAHGCGDAIRLLDSCTTPFLAGRGGRRCAETIARRARVSASEVCDFCFNFPVNHTTGAAAHALGTPLWRDSSCFQLLILFFFLQEHVLNSHRVPSLTLSARGVGRTETEEDGREMESV